MTQQDTPPSTIESKKALLDSKDVPTKETPLQFNRGPRFWTILFVLALVSLLTSLEATVTSTILPSIVADLNGGENYVWIANATFLTMTALLPLFGQLADLFGRKWPLVFSAAAFMVGSGLCGGASSIAMMISGRAIQGIGASGIGVLCEIIIGDLVPLRARGTYMGIVFGMVALGAALGPLFGGLLVSYSTWRWAFYMALPIGGVALVLIVAFLNVKHNKSQTLATKLSSLDWLGNLVFIGGVIPVLVALSWAGSLHPWSSYQVLVPLIVGLAALAAFVLIEGNPRLVPHPMVPTYLFHHSITLTVFILTFLHGIVTMWATYFLPVYFQGVLGASAYRSGIMLLPTILALLPAAGVGGVLLTKLGRYKPILVVAFAMITVGFGLFSMIAQTSSTGTWVGFQVVESFGAGFGMAAMLPALLAPLTDKDTAARFTPTGLRNWRPRALSATRAEVVAVQSGALRRSWQVAIGFGVVGFIAAALMKEVPLRKENNTEFGMVEKGDKPVEEEAGSSTKKEVPAAGARAVQRKDP
ncbi:MFS general substrate transporter, partial [Staphylotrichum tortipilum]